MRIKKHILIVGSPSVHTQNFIKLMKRTNVKISFLGEEPIVDDEISIQKIVDVRSKKGILFGKKKLFNLIKEINPDSIHIQQVNRLAYFTAKASVKLQIPYVATAWGSDVLLIPQKSKVHYNLTKFVLQYATHCTADSDEMIGVMKKIVSNQNYSNINFGIDFKESNLDKIDVIYSNRLHESLYQIDKIIRSFKNALEVFPEWKLVIGGKGSLTNEYKLLVKELGLNGKVDFVGWLSSEENWKHYHQSKVYCSIPTSDGTAISLMEAMYANCYPIVWDLPVAKEWIRNEDSGLIVRDGLDFITTAIQNLQSSTLADNKSLVIEKADKNRVAQKFLELHF